MIITTRPDGNMNDSTSSSANGSCLCRGVQFRVASTEFSGHPKVAHCYCQMCRKFHGSAFSAFMEVRRDKLEWTKGEDLIKNFSMINEAGRETIRSFCSVCGSSLLFNSEFNKTDGTIEVALGTFDHFDSSQPLPRADAHIYTAFKAPWYNIPEDGTTEHFPHFRKQEGGKGAD